MVGVASRPLQALGRYLINSYSFYKSLPLPSKFKYGGLGVLHLVNGACLVHVFTEYVGTISPMHGPSMLPTLAVSGEAVVEDRISVRLNRYNIARGELLVLKSPLDPTRLICKRVIGLPGDTICVDPTGEKAPSTEHVVVPKGHIWIMGDNAAWSRDSRDYGPVPIGLVKSKLRARIWPLIDFKVFSSDITDID